MTDTEYNKVAKVVEKFRIATQANLLSKGQLLLLSDEIADALARKNHEEGYNEAMTRGRSGFVEWCAG